MTDKRFERWRQVPTAIIADVSGGTCLIDSAIRPLCPAGQQPRLFGTALTARCTPPDFGAVLRALDLVKKGDVLVIEAQSHAGHAMIGGILGGHLQRKGAAGVVCDGAIRDVAELAAMKDFSVYACSITPRGPASGAGTAVNVPVVVGGNKITPGDLIIGDDDGLVSLTPEEAEAYHEKSMAKLALEKQWIKRLKAGETLAKLFDLN